MLSKEEFYVLKHYLDEGVSKTAIAKKMGISRMTVHRHSTSDKTEPVYGSPQSRTTLLDPYKDYIRGRLKIYPELSAVRIFKEIEQRANDKAAEMLKRQAEEELIRKDLRPA